MIPGPDASYLLLLVVLIGGMAGYLYATGETTDAPVREKRVAQGESRRALPIDAHVLLTDRGPVPISGLLLIGYLDAAEVCPGIRPGRRYRMQLASWP